MVDFFCMRLRHPVALRWLLLWQRRRPVPNGRVRGLKINLQLDRFRPGDAVAGTVDLECVGRFLRFRYPRVHEGQADPLG